MSALRPYQVKAVRSIHREHDTVICMNKTRNQSEIFPGRLKKARNIRGFSQADLAVRASLRPSAISHFEGGSRKPSFENLRKLALALDVRADYLLGLVDEVHETTGSDPLYRHVDKLSGDDRDLANEFLNMLAKRNKKQMPIRPLVILGVDSGMATCGVCLLVCHGDRVVAEGLTVVHTQQDKQYRAMVDEDIRLRAVIKALGQVHDGRDIDVLAYEYYRPFQQKGGQCPTCKRSPHTGARGRLVSKAEGAIVGYGLAHGMRTIPVDPAEPKQILGAHSKAAVSQVLKAKIEGLTALLDLAGHAGFHGSDAAACAYVAMGKIFKAQRKSQ